MTAGEPRIPVTLGAINMQAADPEGNDLCVAEHPPS